MLRRACRRATDPTTGGGRTQAEAQAAGAQFVASGAQRSAPGTVGAVLDACLAYQGTYGRKERTVKTSANSAARLKRYFDASRPLGEVDTDALAAFVHWRQSGPRRVGAYAINRDLATLRAAWRHAHEDRKAPAPPKWIRGIRRCVRPEAAPLGQLFNRRDGAPEPALLPHLRAADTSVEVHPGQDTFLRIAILGDQK